MQYSKDNAAAADHNSKYSHPCRYSELCLNKEPHLTHEPHLVPVCRYDKECRKLDDPWHRASYRHEGRSDFLIPCYRQEKCQDKSWNHLHKYSHGEQVFKVLTETTSAGK